MPRPDPQTPMGLIRLIVYTILIYAAWRVIRGLLLSAPHHTPEPKPATSTAPQDPHAVLGVSPEATAGEVRAAYQRLVQQYHPDRVSGMGPEIIAVAEQRTKEINAAYAALRRSR